MASSRSRIGRSSSSRHRTTTHEHSDALVPDLAHPYEDLVEARTEMAWWKRPAPWWLMVLAPFSSIISTATVAPQLELYNTLACCIHKPQVTGLETHSSFHQGLWISSSFTIAVDDTVERTFLQSGPPILLSDPCSSDPDVQGAAAKMSAVIDTVNGILTFVTAGWWGSFSDRNGRKKLMGIAAIGQLISSFNILIVAKYLEQIPGGGYWILIVDAVTSGVLGVSTSETAAMFAYISDISTAEKRFRLFSVVSGCMLAGLAIGPMLGSLVVRLTHNPLSVFYMAAAFRILQTCLVWFILPESLPPAQMERALVKHLEIRISTDDRTSLFYVRRLLFFLKPLAVLLPEKTTNRHSSLGARRDWDLPILVLAFGLILLASASLTNQLLYARYTFGWDSEYIGYCLSAIGFSRAIYLILILPLVINFVKSRMRNTGPASSESDLLLPDRDPPRLSHPNTHAFAFDLGLARFSAVVEIATFAALAFAPTGFLFLLFTMLGALGGGVSTAIKSVALDIYSGKFRKNEPVESGKLFGALSVVQSVFSEIIGPPLYGLIYASTVATFPRTIFFVALGSWVVAFALLNCIKLRPEVPDSEDVEDPN
ncbi:major facilitator superfamily domain-containing protein [Mycena rosella]|uniref:Major facilitator superfamily domain-containing protein n=1 Tax=Mycena rosella TaxID=1033263 RepID=A0AAD7DUX1_MYCRO|nr:major facilitator superfamily domain-containing protein [Mycena rosella]